MVFEPNAVYPVSALQRNSREVREAAKEKLLRITENGASAYVFCSEEVLDRTIREAVNEALYEHACLAAIERGEAEIDEGSAFDSVEELRAAVQRKRERVA